jgi:uncharacterized protein (DUF302 family)
MNRFEDQVRARGMTVFAHIDFAAIAAAGGLSLDPTDVLVFGDARAGSALLQQSQIIGLDLPLRAAVWRDRSGVTRLSYTDFGRIARRHRLGRAADATAGGLALALAAIAKAATGPP